MLSARLSVSVAEHGVLCAGVALRKAISVSSTALSGAGAEVLKTVANQQELAVHCLVASALMHSDDMLKRMAQHYRTQEEERTAARVVDTLLCIGEETQARAAEAEAEAESALTEMLDVVDEQAATILAGASVEPEEPEEDAAMKVDAAATIAALSERSETGQEADGAADASDASSDEPKPYDGWGGEGRGEEEAALQQPDDLHELSWLRDAEESVPSKDSIYVGELAEADEEFGGCACLFFTIDGTRHVRNDRCAFSSALALPCMLL